MVRELIHDPIILSKKSIPATIEDESISNDLLDTLIANKSTCVGMAANMIGFHKCIIAFLDESDNTSKYTIMYNPEIISKSGQYETKESCLSLLGGPRPCIRYEKIKVKYQSKDLKPKIKTYTGWTAQIIQHEIDHCNGILI